MSFKGKVVAVTGAGSGIGRELAMELAHRRAKLALCDVDHINLVETVNMARKLGSEVYSDVLDVTDRQAVAEYAASVNNHFGVINQIYNNAGVGAGSRALIDMDYADIDRVLSVNLFGVINGSKEFLPYIIKSGNGAIVNISSLNGFLGQGNLTAYCSSKFAVRGFTEALRAEMMAAGLPVKVCVVHPGGVKTNIANASMREASMADVSEEERQWQENRLRVYNEKLLKLSPEKTANIILEGVQKGRQRIIVGNDAKWVDRIVRFLPESYTKLVVRKERKMFGARPGTA